VHIHPQISKHNLNIPSTSSVLLAAPIRSASIIIRIQAVLVHLTKTLTKYFWLSQEITSIVVSIVKEENIVSVLAEVGEEWGKR